MSHLEDVNMTYCEHFGRSIYFSFIFMRASIKAFIHSLCPDVWIDSTTEVHEILADTL
jgi:hypothetical protein